MAASQKMDPILRRLTRLARRYAPARNPPRITAAFSRKMARNAPTIPMISGKQDQHPYRPPAKDLRGQARLK